MSLPSQRFPWTFIGVLAMLAISTVYAYPIKASTTEDQAQPMSVVQPRDPRLIPDTEHYLAAVLDLLGVPDPTPTDNTPIETPSVTGVPKPLATAEQGHAINIDATPVISDSGVMYSATIKHGNQKPIENIQIGSGYHAGKKLSASDLPIIFAAMETGIASRWRDVIDSSDELGLDDEFGL